MSELVGNEKLLAARAAIEAVLKQFDIAGHVVLHCPGFVEVFFDLEPSYSKVTVVKHEHGAEVRVRSKLADYAGDAEAQRRDLEATAGMAESMGETLREEALDMLSLATHLNRVLGAEHTPLRPVQRNRGKAQ